MAFVKLLLSTTFLLCVFASLGQTQRPVADANKPYGDFSNGSNRVTEVRFDGINNNRIDYSKINGTPFWNPNWQKARVFVNDIQSGTLTVRINLATNELHYLRDTEELVVKEVNITKLIFDSTEAPIVFIRDIPDLLLNRKKVDGFMQEMNSGGYQLLKYRVRRLNSADSLLNTQKRYFFYDDVVYFLRSSNRVKQLKKLNKETLFGYLPSASLYNNWVSETKADLTLEADVILFLKYYNSQINSIPKSAER